VGASGIAHRDALDLGCAAHNGETRFAGAGQDGGERRLAGPRRTHERQRAAVRQFERHAVDHSLRATGASGSREGEIHAPDGDIGISTARHEFILP
jgi:hypothetical protein